MITAGAALPFWNEPAMAQLSAIRGAMPPDTQEEMNNFKTAFLKVMA
jgi:hypothetical protein